ncbi:ATP-binding protein [Streptomyces sp. 4N509B]|uniref:ATP-binding protein n=1 Tax=Streptomyces sp. 4N509B TaxID=3457413 RepID=UPI003FD655DC
MPTHRRTFPGRAEDVTRARHWTRAILGNHPHTDDAALIVTELAANAITHTASATDGFTLTLTIAAADDGPVTIAVTDAGGTTSTPHVEQPDACTPHGRGLALVTAYATRVTIYGDHHGHTVTAHLATTPARQPQPC